MKLLVKRLLFCFIILTGLITTFVLRNPLHTQTDLMSLIKNDNVAEQWSTNKISDKISSVLNIVIESTDEKVARNNANEIIKTLNTDTFNTLSVQSGNFSLKGVTKDLIPYKNSLLSAQFRNLLQENKSKQIADIAIKQISESMMPPLIPIHDDPFLLLSDYLININSGNSVWTLNNGLLWQYKDNTHYFMIPVNVNTSDTSESAKQVKILYNEYNIPKNNDVKIHISGIPLHTAFMVQKSQLQLGILSFLAILMAVIFNYLLFKKLFALIPVLAGLLIGFLCGTVALFLCFNTPHILTFVFGTTLIGLGIDYAFHFITAATLKKRTQIYTNLHQSFLTTLVCFLPLLFSQISLLQQISVFTITGLVAIYFGLKLFLPNRLDIKIKPIKTNRYLPKKMRILFLSLIGIIIIATLPFAKTENNMNQLYRPDLQIAAQDAFFQKLNHSQQSAVLMVRGKTIQEILETEEDIKSSTNEQFLSLSSIIPSIKTQIENQQLIKQLYTNQSGYLKKKLELKETPVFQESKTLSIINIKSEFINEWIDKLIIRDGGYIYSISQIRPNLQINQNNAMIVNPSEILTNQIEKYSHETYRLLAICAICLIALLIVFYKKRAVLYLIPSILAILLSVSVLTWFNQPITFFHMLSFFIVTGLGLDYTIFNMNTNDAKEIRPVLFSFLTSFVGFGMLAFTSFFLIKSMGITLGLGLVLSYLISLFLFRTR
jgi:predicted exporter